MKVITIDHLKELIARIGFKKFNHLVIDALEEDFKNWQLLKKSPRHATHYPAGVIELMPCSDDTFYAFKYVNGHPKNPREGKLCVVALGVLADVASGYPLMESEMTLLTAIRTAATAALGAKYLARQNTRHVAIIGTGAQAEFQIAALNTVFPLEKVSYYDIDRAAMEKFHANLSAEEFELLPCNNIAEAVADVDLVVTATAAKQKNIIMSADMLVPGMHIHAMGGDCPGKTEFDSSALKKCKVVVEYIEQSLLEGEIQECGRDVVYAELWEIVTGAKFGRVNEQEITFFDSVGFAVEDFSILKLIYKLAIEQGIGEETHMIPALADPKNLYGLLFSP